MLGSRALTRVKRERKKGELNKRRGKRGEGRGIRGKRRKKGLNRITPKTCVQVLNPGTHGHNLLRNKVFADVTNLKIPRRAHLGLGWVLSPITNVTV